MVVTTIVDGLSIADEDTALRIHDEYDTVVTLTKRNAFPSDEMNAHCPLVDGENEQIVFDNAVRVVRDAWDNGDDVLVHCAVGTSRSPTVVTAVIADVRDLRFEDAFDVVRDAKGSVTPHPDIVNNAKEYLDEEPYDSMGKDPV